MGPIGKEADAMELVRQMLETVRTQLSKLSVSHKLLIASLGVILLMTLGFVGLYAGKAAMIELLPGMPAEQQRSASVFLTASNIRNELRPDGKLVVPADRELQARALLAENGKLGGDKAILFDNLLEKQSWMHTRDQNAQIYLIALQNQLALDISGFRNVKSATVILDVPEAAGIGRNVRRPSASATVVTRDGGPLPQATVDAIAGYIAGSRAGLEIDRVRVIDATTGIQRKARQADDMGAAGYLEHAAKVEQQAREKIQELLSYIPGVIVAVTAQVDVTRVSSEEKRFLPEGQGSISSLKKSTDETTTSTQGGSSAEPGVRPNVSADLNARGGTGTSTNTNRSDSEFTTNAGTRTQTVVDMKGMPTMVAVSVNIPRGFVSRVLQEAGKGANAPAGGSAGQGPTEDEINQRFTADLKPKIEAILRPHVRAMTAAANGALADAELDKIMQQSISVGLIPIDIPMGMGGGAQQAGVLGGVTTSLAMGGGLVEKVALGALAAVALGMMLVMVKKAGKKQEMPTAEELVGMPPALETGGDLIGEAEEGAAALEGIEVGEETVQSQQILEQVSKMVESNPQGASKLLNRWISTET